MQKNISLFKTLAVCIVWLCLLSIAYAEPLKVGQTAPDFQLTAQDGSEVNLASRKGVGWTVLYFYPKAGTPGCTAQACAFRDAIQAIRKQNAEVYGISTDEIKALQAFHQQHNQT